MLRWAEPLRGAARDIEAQAAVAVGRDKVYSFGGREFLTHYRIDEMKDGSEESSTSDQMDFGGREDLIAYSDEELEDGSEESPTSDQMDVHIFNMVALRWIKLPAVMTETGQRPFEVPSARILHTATLIGDTVYVCGGIPSYGERESRTELYGFNIDTHTWSRPEVRGTVPPLMYNHSACVLGKIMYVYGAWYVDEDVHDADMFKLDTSTMVWCSITTGGPKPPVSIFESATAIGTKIVLFRGIAPDSRIEYQYYNIRVFDTEANIWLISSPSAQPHPEGREDHSAFTYDGELYIFAGRVSDPGARYFDLNDMWKFNPETFCWKKVEPKGKQPSQRCGMGCCMVGDRMVLFGGVQLDVDRPCDDLLILEMSPSLKTLCKLAVIQCNLEQAELPHDIRWELAAMTRDGAC